LIGIWGGEAAGRVARSVPSPLSRCCLFLVGECGSRIPGRIHGWRRERREGVRGRRRYGRARQQRTRCQAGCEELHGLLNLVQRERFRSFLPYAQKVPVSIISRGASRRSAKTPTARHPRRLCPRATPATSASLHLPKTRNSIRTSRCHVRAGRGLFRASTSGRRRAWFGLATKTCSCNFAGSSTREREVRFVGTKPSYVTYPTIRGSSMLFHHMQPPSFGSLLRGAAPSCATRPSSRARLETWLVDRAMRALFRSSLRWF